MKSSRRKWLKKRVPRVLLISGGLLIIVFNDAFGDNETFGIFGFLYFLLLFFLFFRWVFLQVKSILRLKNEKAQTELQHLKSQVNPHFFFNMLNNLYGLVEKDSKKAQQLILKLSDMMRYSIYDLNNYIALHKMRYHKEIEVVFTLKVQDENTPIMPLLFIILLENAFKHGVENLRNGAYVHIDLTTTETTLDFKVENNFDAAEVPEKGGIGLKNLRRRLELVYPNNHSVSLSQTEDVFKAHLNLKKL
jgi:two-component system sensor histidine kinase AlgZ